MMDIKNELLKFASTMIRVTACAFCLSDPTFHCWPQFSLSQWPPLPSPRPPCFLNRRCRRWHTPPIAINQGKKGRKKERGKERRSEVEKKRKENLEKVSWKCEKEKEDERKSKKKRSDEQDREKERKKIARKKGRSD